MVFFFILVNVPLPSKGLNTFPSSVFLGACLNEREDWFNIEEKTTKQVVNNKLL